MNGPLAEKIYQTLETAFHRQAKHLEFVFGCPDETQSLVFDILHLQRP